MDKLLEIACIKISDSVREEVNQLSIGCCLPDLGTIVLREIVGKMKSPGKGRYSFACFGMMDGKLEENGETYLMEILPITAKNIQKQRHRDMAVEFSLIRGMEKRKVEELRFLPEPFFLAFLSIRESNFLVCVLKGRAGQSMDLRRKIILTFNFPKKNYVCENFDKQARNLCEFFSALNDAGVLLRKPMKNLKHAPECNSCFKVEGLRSFQPFYKKTTCRKEQIRNLGIVLLFLCTGKDFSSHTDFDVVDFLDNKFKPKNPEVFIVRAAIAALKERVILKS